jgi:hypothetical protein
MTNVEFQEKLQQMFEKHSIISKSKIKSLNELVYVLRVEGDVDYQVITNTGMCIPSVRETFIPIDWLAKKVAAIEYVSCDDEYDGQFIHQDIVIVDLE